MGEMDLNAALGSNEDRLTVETTAKNTEAGPREAINPQRVGGAKGAMLGGQGADCSPPSLPVTEVKTFELRHAAATMDACAAEMEQMRRQIAILEGQMEVVRIFGRISAPEAPRGQLMGIDPITHIRSMAKRLRELSVGGVSQNVASSGDSYMPN